MTGFVGAVLVLLGGLGVTALGDMVSEEVRDRLDHLPHAILRIAACRLDTALRAAVYEDEWMPELTYILKGDEARPVTRLYHGTRFAIGILATARQSARHLRVVPVPSAPGLLVREQDVDVAEHLFRTVVSKCQETEGLLAMANEQLMRAASALLDGLVRPDWATVESGKAACASAERAKVSAAQQCDELGNLVEELRAMTAKLF